VQYTNTQFTLRSMVNPHGEDGKEWSMGDLGNDTGSTALSLSAKVLAALLRILEKLFDAWRNNPERKLTKYKLEQAKTDAEKLKIVERLEGKVGYVNYQELKRSGLELKPLGIYMTKADMKEFAALCKREGVIFSGMTNNTEKNADGIKTYQIVCKAKDLEKIKSIVDRINVEKMIDGIDKRIAELEAKGKSMTEQDKLDIAALKEQKASLQRNYCAELNGEMAHNIIEKAVTGEVKDPLTLDEALNRLTGRHIDKDTVTIVADANDPSKYIKCHGYQDKYKDQEYIKTEYEVYRGSKKVLATHDGRFDNRPKNYWEDQKNAIQKAGEFSGTFFKFSSVVEYQKWAEATRKQNAHELASMDKSGASKDYSVILKDLEKQLEERNAMIKDGVVVDKDTGEPIGNIEELAENITEEKAAAIAEIAVIGKQIENYKSLQELEGELAVAKAEVLTTGEGTKERDEAETALAQVQEKLDTALGKEAELITERKEINAVQSEQEVRDAAEIEIENNREFLPEDKSKIEKFELRISKEFPNQITEESFEEFKRRLEEMKAEAVKNARKAGHTLAERGDAKATKQYKSIEDAKAAVAKQKAADASKQAELAGRGVLAKGSEITQAAKAARPITKSER